MKKNIIYAGLGLLAALWMYAQAPLPSPVNVGGGGGKGSGTVTSIATSCGVTGGTITTSGTIKQSQAVNAQTGTTYTVLDGDCGKLVTATNAAAIAVTLPQANGSTFVAGWTTDVYVGGAGTVTITPTTSTINGAATLVLYTGFSAHIVSDGTNYTAELFAGFDPSKNGCSLQSGFTSGGLAFCVANVAGTATTLIWPLDSGSAANATVLTLGAVATCPTLLPAFAPTTCRFMTWTSAGGGSAPFTDFQPPTSAITMSAGSPTDIYAIVAPALASGKCYATSFAVELSSGPTEISIYVDATLVWDGILSLTGTNELINLLYCNGPGTQTTQYGFLTAPYFYGAPSTVNPYMSRTSGATTPAFTLASNMDWSSGRTIHITGMGSGTVTGLGEHTVTQ